MLKINNEMRVYYINIQVYFQKINTVVWKSLFLDFKCLLNQIASKILIFNLECVY